MGLSMWLELGQTILIMLIAGFVGFKFFNTEHRSQILQHSLDLKKARLRATGSESFITDRVVLLCISSGLIIILLVIIVGIYLTPRALPNWAENVLVSIGTATALKLGDCLSTLQALSSGRNIQQLGTQLGQSVPTDNRLKDDKGKALGTHENPMSAIVTNAGEAEALPVKPVDGADVIEPTEEGK